MRAELQAIKTLLETNGLPLKKVTLDDAPKKLGGISALVDFWWQTVRQDWTQLDDAEGMSLGLALEPVG